MRPLPHHPRRALLSVLGRAHGFVLLTMRRWLGRDHQTPKLARVSRWGSAVLAVMFVLVVLAAATGATWLNLRTNLRADVARQLERSQSVVNAVRIELSDLSERVLPADCSTLRATLISASLDSAVSRRIWVHEPGQPYLCGPDQRAFPALARTLAALIETAVRPSEPFELIALGEEPTLLGIFRSPSGRVLVSQIELRALAVDVREENSHGSKRFGLLASKGIRTQSQDRAIRWLGGAAAGRSDTVYAGRWPWAAMTVLTVEQAGAQFPLIFTSTVTLYGLAQQMRPSVLPSLALAVALLLLTVTRINSRLAQRSSPERRLRKAVRLHQIEPVIQPIVEAATGRCIGGEVLMRWDHPVRGLVAPGEFIELAEQTQLIRPMSQIMMRKARDRLAPTLAVFPNLYFSFNVTAAQLADPGFSDDLGALFDEQSLPPRNVMLEMIERDVINAQMSETLAALRRQGYRIAVDDFGTGQSSLALLARIECDRLKIDREFVRSIDEEAINRPVLDAIIDLSRRLALPAIAEGVETQAQRAYLTAQGVAALQGYLIAKPMPIANFLVWLDENDRWIRSADEAQRAGQLLSLGVNA